MKRPRSKRAPTTWSRLRPWVFPALAVVVALSLLDFGFDAKALRNELRQGQVDAALERLARARPGQLDPLLADVNWWPPAARAARLQQLVATPRSDLLEAPDLPTLVAPLDSLREPPAEARLREPAQRDLQFILTNVELNLIASERDWPAGSDRLAFEVTLIPGTSYTMTLQDQATGGFAALAAFRVLGQAQAQDAGLALGAAFDLAGGEPGGQLLAGVVALQRGLHDEALRRFAQLPGDAGWAAPVRELTAITLAEQGLDLTALALLEEPPP